MSPIFMIGTQRSGSNLLRLMLNQLPELASPHPPHILQRMHPLMATYGDLAADEAFAALVDDVCRLVELNPVPWEGVVLDRADVTRRCRERSLVAVFGAVYDVCAQAQGAQTWCCKSLANVNYGEDLERYFKDAKFLYLYRDGRDVAVSFAKAVVGEKHYYHIGKDWAATQRKALAIRELVPEARFCAVSYEELTTDTEQVAKRLCDFLGVAYSEAMLDFHHSEEARRAADSSSLWNNVVRPVMSDNSKKYLREATPEQVAVFERIAGTVLDALGYERAYVPVGTEAPFSETEIASYDAENERLKQKVRDSMDQGDLERRDRQAGLLKEIESRHAA
jgi:LPS sulfotransferase NodH